MLKHDPVRKACKNLLLLTPALILLVGTGCGGAYSYKNTPTTTLTSADTSNSTPTTAGASVAQGTQAPFKVKIQGSGYDTHAVTVSAGSVLKVRFVSGKQNQSTSGKFYAYSMLMVYVGIGSNLQPTEMVHNGYLGYAPEQSTVIDLSDSFAHTCSSSDPSCRQQVTINIAQPNNDDECLNSSLVGCPYSHVPSGHAWNGTLLIQTDDTTPI